MNVHGISPFLAGPQAGASGNWSIPGGDDFAGKLQLGQIIKGRVLRHMEGSRYAVDFGGREKVVDSAVPFKTGDLLYGKVIGLGERVELERVRAPASLSDAQAAADGAAPEAAFWSRGDSASKLVAGLFEQFNGRLAPEQAAVIEQGVRAASDQRTMALSGLLLAKLGIGVSPALLKAAYEVLRSEPRRGLFALNGKALELQTADLPAQAADRSGGEPPVAALAELLKQALEQTPEKEWQDGMRLPSAGGDAESMAARGGDGGGNNGDGNGNAGPGYDPGRWLFNAQTGGSVAHRVNTVPLLVNGRLLELNIAVFEQPEGQARAQEGTRHRQLCFSLHSEQLGQVEARLAMTGDRMKMTLSSDREAAAEWLAACSPDLTRQLKEDGWQVDELHYETRRADGKDGSEVARAVLQHVISQDSVSRLV